MVYSPLQETKVAGQSTQEQMRSFMSLKYSRPHHSQLYANQYELLCIDDDPVFQVVNHVLIFNWPFNDLSCLIFG